MRIITIIAGLLLLCTLAPTARAHFDLPPTPYRDEGPFVHGPATVGGFIGVVPGAALGGVVGLFAGDPLSGGALGGVVGYQALGHVVGAPFYGLKKLFYDGPRKLAGKK